MAAHEDDPNTSSSSSFLWDWDSVLLLAHPTDTSKVALDHVDEGVEQQQQHRRRRDPRLSCPNFLAGRIPCACSDEEDEEEADRSKKRSKLSSASCQVPACHADLAGLKGYHQRHRVCLTCANATSVLVRGQNQRYCQQCGKFHPLGDFDDDKRSCRRKLERHNVRRRRKQPESVDTSVVDGATPCSNNTDDGAPSANEQQLLPGPQPQEQPQCDSQVTSTSAEQSLLAMLLDEQQKQAVSTTPKRTSYTSPCPTRRISFKFYDWNPADFPRRLREQIMDWLANMPVELEGYIRSGCTILTLFIAMPRSLWAELDDDWNGFLVKLVTRSETGFWDRGFVAAFLDNQVAYIHDGRVSSPSLCERATKKCPVIESVFPPCVEVGTETTVTLTGHNLCRINSRVLFGSRGKYLPCCIRPSHLCTGSCMQVDVVFPQEFGVAFVEIGYGHGISNSVPLLIADKQMCEEVQTLGQGGYSEQSELLTDLGWVMSRSSQVRRASATSMHVTRLQQLLAFAAERGWNAATRQILQAARQEGQAHRLDTRRALQLAVASDSTDIIKALLLFQQDSFYKVWPDASPPRRRMCSGLGQSGHLRYKRKTIAKVAVGLLVACAGFCLVIQHPRQVFQISASLRRCLWYTP